MLCVCFPEIDLIGIYCIAYTPLQWVNILSYGDHTNTLMHYYSCVQMLDCTINITDI